MHLPTDPLPEEVNSRTVAEDIRSLLDSQTSILQQLRKTIVGQDQVVEEVMIAIYVGGHCLITGLPGLAKTLLVRTISRTLGLSFKRIQFTPDLMPADITGTELIEEDRTSGRRELVFARGPIFSNLILADEINRTPPKTQAALLEAMQERHVTVGGKTYILESPFFVLATQNPIELEGTYPLPEAQLDRFMLNIVIDYLGAEDEIEVVRRTTSQIQETAEKVVSGEDILKYQALIRQIPASEDVMSYAVKLVRATRPGTPEAPQFVSDWLSYGASLRASQYLILGGKARALLHGRYNVSYDDVRALAKPVLRHRILTNFQAQSEDVRPDHIVQRLLEELPPPAAKL